MPSIGFVVITSIALMLVIFPSVVLLVYGWRSGKWYRIASLAACLVLAFFGAAIFEMSAFETSVVTFYMFWMILLYLGGVLYACVFFIAKLPNIVCK